MKNYFLKNKYIEKSIEGIKYRLKEEHKNFHPDLNLRIREILNDLWFAALKRQASYIVKPDK
jgi:hypothetical protein